MVLMTEKAVLVSRFDMLFTPEMKVHVKKNGGASYIRDLVEQDMIVQRELEIIRANILEGIATESEIITCSNGRNRTPYGRKYKFATY